MQFTIYFCRRAQILTSILACLLCWVHGAPASSREDIGDHIPNTHTILSSSEDLAKSIAHQANRLNSEICKMPSVCDSFESLMDNHLNLPKMVSADGCFQRGFNKENCLHKIHKDLVEFQKYLLYVEKSYTDQKRIVELIRYKTRDLANNLNMVEQPNSVIYKDNVSLIDLKSESLWTQKVTIHLILQSFTDYMEHTVRAIRHSNQKKDHA